MSDLNPARAAAEKWVRLYAPVRMAEDAIQERVKHLASIIRTAFADERAIAEFMEQDRE